MSTDQINIQLQTRSVTGKAVKHLRKKGIVPGVIHDHGKESIIVEGSAVEVLKAYRQAGKHHPVNIKTDKKSYTAMIKFVEFEPTKQGLSHIVFNSVNANQQVEAEVPLEPKYDEGNDSSPAERSGLIVLRHVENVEVMALPNSIPDVLYYPAEKLVEVGDHVSVSDLEIPNGVVIKTDLSQSIASVYEPSALAAANDAIAGDSEEAITSEESSEDTTENLAVESSDTEEKK